MKHALLLKPTQTGRALALLAALGFTALVGLASLEPAVGPVQRTLPAAHEISQSVERETGVHVIEPGVLAGESSQHFERSSEPATETDTVNAHGG